jgi:hypothetical protein
VHDIFRAGSTVALLSSPEKQDESRWFSSSVGCCAVAFSEIGLLNIFMCTGAGHVDQIMFFFAYDVTFHNS